MDAQGRGMGAVMHRDVRANEALLTPMDARRPSRPKIHCDPALTEEVVLREIRRREEEGDLRASQEYHLQADPIYERFPVPAREAEFEKLHRKFFLDLGFTELVMKAVLEFPELAATEEVFIGNGMTEREEAADLSRDRKRVGIKIRPARFSDPQGLSLSLRHEFQHVADMLDETFGHPLIHESGLALCADSPAEAHLIRDRYRRIWDIYIDGRLRRKGKETISDKEERYSEFEALFRSQSVSSQQVVAAFEALWTTEKLTHAEIVEMAGDPNKILERGGAQEEFQQRALFPGSLCPLCRFPTFHWAEGLHELPEEVMESLKGDFPMWRPEEGSCERCIEVYRARAGVLT